MSDVPPEQSPSGTGWRPPTGGYEPPGSPPPPPGGAGQPPQYPPPPPGGYQQPGYQQPGYQQGPLGPGGQPLAEWWKRLVAVLLDGLILGVPLGIVRAVVGVDRSVEIDPLTGEVTRGEGFLAGVGLVLFLLSIVLPILYAGILNGSDRGQTIGKMALKIQVRDASSGGPIGVGRGLVRAVVYNLLFLACLIPGFINGLSPLWDQRRQAWHDKAASSVVVDAP